MPTSDLPSSFYELSAYEQALGFLSRARASLDFILVSRHLDDLDRRQIDKSLFYLDELGEYIHKAKAERREDEKRLSVERQPAASQEDGHNRTSAW